MNGLVVILKKLFAVILTAAIMLASASYTGAVSAKGAVLIEADSKAVIYSVNEDMRLPMASTTKIMTAVITLERVPLDSVVTVSKRAAETEGSSMYLKESETVTVLELLYGLMLVSGNDAATALAEYVGGSVEGFVALMNEKARSLGLANTSFETPSGLDGKAHYSTAYDMALLAAYALKNDAFAEIVATKTASFDGRYLVNHNRLLFSNEYVIGVKTGYTMSAGRCLVTAAKKDGVTLVAVTLSDRNDWNDHAAMYEDAFQRLEKTYYCREDDVYKIPVVGASKNFVRASPNKSLFGVSFDGSSDADVSVLLPRFLYADVKCGDTVGKISVKSADGTVLETDIIANESIEAVRKISLWDRILSLFIKYSEGENYA